MDPRHYHAEGVLRDGAPIVIRAVRPEDREALKEGFAHLSERSVYHRFFQTKRELKDTELTYLTELDFQDHVGLVAVLPPPPAAAAAAAPSRAPGAGEEGQPIGVGRFVRAPGRHHAEVAFVVGDEFQGRGVGTLLLEHLACIARTLGVTDFEADVLSDNTQMLEVFQHSGLPLTEEGRDGIIHVRMDLLHRDKEGGPDPAPAA